MTAAPHDAELAPIREAVRALCAEFPGEYWRKVDRERAYPTEFVEALTKAGFLGALIPEEYGGSGLTMPAAAAIMEEIHAAGCNGAACHAQMYTMGTVLRHGSAAQKQQYLPGIASGALRLQAFGVTEPTSGTDTSSLKTFARREGDHYVVNGQKIWTTLGQHADWIFALVRTDPDAQPRHAGISFLLIDLHSPGIRIRPIMTIAGDDEFAEVFFDDVEVPAENLVGKLNDGWRIANALLGHERLGTSNPQFALQALDRIKAMARATGIIADPAFQDRLAAASINVTALSAMFAHAVELTNNERSLGPESSVVKIFSSELLQSLNELLIEAAGGHAAMENPVATNAGVVDVAIPFLFSRRVTIYGGSSEIQRNVLARRVLNLPA